MTPFLLVLAMSLNLSSTHATPYKDHEQIKKEFKTPHLSPQLKKPVPYPKLDEVIPKDRQGDLKAKKEKRTKSKKLVAPGAACRPRHDALPKKIEPLPTPTESITPVPIPTQTSTAPLPLPTLSPSPSPLPSVTPPPPSPLPSLVPITPTIPTGVDLRSYDSYIRYQFGQSCTAHAVGAGMENILNKTGRGMLLSIRYLWSEYQTLNSLAALKAASSHLQVSESLWPETAPSPVMTLNTLASQGKHKLSNFTYLEDNQGLVQAQLDQGFPVYIAVTVPSDLATCLSSIRPDTTLTTGGHAMLVVGYKEDSEVSGGGYWILKNSWGTACGDQGYHYWPWSLCDRSDLYCEFYSFSGVL